MVFSKNQIYLIYAGYIVLNQFVSVALLVEAFVKKKLLQTLQKARISTISLILLMTQNFIA